VPQLGTIFYLEAPVLNSVIVSAGGCASVSSR